jgi:hypothetical protein
MPQALTLEEWSWIGTIASSIFSFLALAAIVFAWLQIRTSRKVAAAADANAREVAAAADANAIQRSLIEKSLELPQFVAPKSTIVNVKGEKFDGSEVEFRRYEVFVELVLTTFDHLVSNYSSDKPTRNYMIQVLAEHRKYLDSQYFRTEFWNQLSPELMRLVEEGIEYDKQRNLRYERESSAA